MSKQKCISSLSPGRGGVSSSSLLGRIPSLKVGNINGVGKNIRGNVKKYPLHFNIKAVCWHGKIIKWGIGERGITNLGKKINKNVSFSHPIVNALVAYIIYYAHIFIEIGGRGRMAKIPGLHYQCLPLHFKNKLYVYSSGCSGQLQGIRSKICC